MMSTDPYGELLTAMREFSLESDRYVERVAALYGLHRTDLNALGYLVRPGVGEKPLTPGKLGAALNLSSPATTALVDRLERSGHVTRQRSRTDRRQVDLAMTDHAGEVGRAMFGPLAAVMRGALGKYTPGEVELLTRFLHEMTAATEAAGDAVAAPAGGAAHGAGRDGTVP
ncbi:MULTISPECIES: MarR family winged helix-turn-helix transcriptional regulator [unclassified Arthrobacter]|uniref:MarR family winged helix-turn-helix transcriptional regulator n=1 Tax=unclassified Arthrobacter TaxID=235627 RepID=UPI00159E2F94|nr:MULTISPECIES: MarR family transcriptional regulator [unclassified Arthrobacter]MCQ9164047.1 MarR family transcriptional regulator [Arthrobacter sp. STN4]NVM97843.1 MarR family transcriptional regulator [Arthrobacter sp. SDTb3-6]